MAYHDYGHYVTHWNTDAKKDEPETKKPAVKILSPQKKLYDIQQVINSLPENHMTMVQLSDAIQKILDEG